MLKIQSKELELKNTINCTKNMSQFARDQFYIRVKNERNWSLYIAELAKKDINNKLWKITNTDL